MERKLRLGNGAVVEAYIRESDAVTSKVLEVTRWWGEDKYKGREPCKETRPEDEVCFSADHVHSIIVTPSYGEYATYTLAISIQQTGYKGHLIEEVRFPVVPLNTDALVNSGVNILELMSNIGHNVAQRLLEGFWPLFGQGVDTKETFYNYAIACQESAIARGVLSDQNEYFGAAFSRANYIKQSEYHNSQFHVVIALRRNNRHVCELVGDWH